RPRARTTSRPSARRRGGSWRALRRPADAADLPIEGDARALAHAPAHFLAQPLDIGGGGAAGVDQEIGVLLRDHRAAAHEAAAAGAVDQLPCLVTGRVGEGRAAGAGADRLRRLARRLDLGHALADGSGIALLAAEHRLDENPILRDLAVAVGEAE